MQRRQKSFDSQSRDGSRSMRLTLTFLAITVALILSAEMILPPVDAYDRDQNVQLLLAKATEKSGLVGQKSSSNRKQLLQIR